jgi:hypothetical protein
MTKQQDIFNPAADHIPDAGKMADKPPRSGSGVMSEAQWQAWMRRVADRMRAMQDQRKAQS